LVGGQYLGRGPTAHQRAPLTNTVLTIFVIDGGCGGGGVQGGVRVVTP